MDVHKLWTDDRAVSPVVGVALLIAITVILAAVIGGVVLGLGTSSAEAPQASLQFEYDNSSSELFITHEGGEALQADQIEIRSSGNTDITNGFNNDTSAGEQETITLGAEPANGETFSVVWEDPNSNDEAVIGSWTYRP